MQDPMDWLWDRGLKKKAELLSEDSSQDQLGLHGKVIPVKTKDFEGHAHISFDRVLRGKHSTHSYGVTYKGKGPGGEHSEYNRLDVEHSNGRIYKHKMHPHSSKDLATVIHKAAPVWVPLSALKPKTNTE